jgi:hypothetical protein
MQAHYNKPSASPKAVLASFQGRQHLGRRGCTISSLAIPTTSRSHVVGPRGATTGRACREYVAVGSVVGEVRG